MTIHRKKEGDIEGTLFILLDFFYAACYLFKFEKAILII
jgi:hypothetical protein